MPSQNADSHQVEIFEASLVLMSAIMSSQSQMSLMHAIDSNILTYFTAILSSLTSCKEYTVLVLTAISGMAELDERMAYRIAVDPIFDLIQDTLLFKTSFLQRAI